ncbi:unnamed protein product [Darwinula stevensoni]|uniref:Apple domain-containing protein n=1 Tax=Darwinula stevensoni TaxID=69355 RepID=A0A7R9A0B9_9CRUS|nr:unnamed protein product [Darwinula stevensoni]CAG0884305.1 unnamed protein product [Darwinula stevensoni]
MLAAMANTLMVFTVSCLFWIGSASEPVVYWELHPGERYGLVSKEISADFEKCENICAKDDPSLPCKAFNYRESDGTCQLVYKDGVQLVPADDFQAFVKFSCLEEDSKMKKRSLDEQRREKSSLRMHEGELESLKGFHGRKSLAKGAKFMKCTKCQVHDVLEGEIACPLPSKSSLHVAFRGVLLVALRGVLLDALRGDEDQQKALQQDLPEPPQAKKPKAP